MQIMEGRTQFQIEGKTAVAIGKFDGIHQGHEKLLSCIKEQKKNNLLATVFTFDFPASVFFENTVYRELTTRNEKRKYFLNAGIDILVEFPLNKQTAAILPSEFIAKILVKQMNMAYVAAGTDLSFGAGGKGNQELLLQKEREYGYKTQIIEKVMFDGREISSTYVKEEVDAGNMEKVKKLMGRNYFVEGIVREGRRLGRRLGIPTVNLYPPEEKLLPPNGVYYSNVIYQQRTYPGITNIGRKPTVEDNGGVSVETYLYDFQGDLYGEEIVTELIQFKRPETKFQSVEELKAHIEQDIKEGRRFHGISG